MSGQSHASERRRHRRYGVSWSAEISEGSASPFVVEVANVSEGGLCIVSVRNIDVGTSLYLRLSQWDEAPLHGVVRWVEQYGGPTYAGVQFDGVTDRQSAALRALVTSIDREDWGGT